MWSLVSGGIVFIALVALYHLIMATEDWYHHWQRKEINHIADEKDIKKEE